MQTVPSVEAMLSSVEPPEGISPEVAVLAAYKPKLVRHAIDDASLARTIAEFAESNARMTADFQLRNEERDRAMAVEHEARLDEIEREARHDFDPTYTVDRTYTGVILTRADSEEAAYKAKLGHIESLAEIREKAKALNERGQRLYRVKAKLGRGATALSLATGALFGFAGTGMLLNHTSSDGLTHHDPSILPGKKPLLGIPGVIDSNSGTATYDVYKDRYVVRTTLANGQQYGTAANPYAQNFKLSGAEAELDKTALAPVMTELKKHNGHITNAVVTGVASDETNSANANLGEFDDRNYQLAADRASAASQALTAVAQERGVAIDHVSEQHYENLLTPEEIAQVDTLATAAGMSRQTFLHLYDTEPGHLGTNERAQLDKFLQRGVTFDLSYSVEQKTTENQPTVSSIKEHLDGTPLEFIAIGWAYLFGVYFAIFGNERVCGRLAHFRANRQVHRAERRAAKA